jgi:hypothetical protein
MASPESSRGTRIPSLSWESVVDGGGAAAAPEGGPSAETGDAAPPPPLRPESPLASAPPEPEPPLASVPDPITFETPPLDPSPSEPISFAPMELSTPPLPTTRPTTDTSSSPVSIPPLGAAIPVLGDLGGVESSTPVETDPRPSGRVSPIVEEESDTAVPPAPRPSRTPSKQPSGRTTITRSAEVPAATIAPAPLSAPDVPADQGAPPAPPEWAPEPTEVDAPDPSDALPPIREATPVPEVAPAPAVASPALPQVPAAAPAAPSPAPAPVAMVVPTTTSAPKRPRRGLTLLFTIVVLGSLVAAAVVFGPRYLFPDDWDAAAKPYAEAVETVRGVEIAEPVAVIAEPVGAYDTRAATELFGDRSDEQPVWRALGLLNGSVRPSTLGELLSGWTSASYSAVDGQVHHDDSLVGGVLDSAVTEAMAAAALDQDHRWSTDQAERTLDGAALVGAEVLRQSRSVRSASEFSAPVPEAAPGLLLFLPPVLGYEAMAPTVYAEFALASAPGDPVEVIADGGAGVLPTATTALAPAPTMISGDTVLTSPRAESRSFWFLVFAAYLDSRSAYVASEAVVESSLTVAQRTETQCAYATFAGGDVGRTGAVRGALERWVAAAPAELAASFSVLPDGTLQLVSCDPGVGFENPVRGGVARELIGWRVAELTTVEAVRAAGGGAEDLARSWAAVEASGVGVELGSLPGETAPSDIAEAARAAVTAVFFPEG